jgi:hypothetical protein
MSNRNRGLVLVAAGVLLALIALGADTLGLGDQVRIGWKQVVGTAAGVAIALAGVRDLRR